MQFIKIYPQPRMLLTFLVQHTFFYIWITDIENLCRAPELIRTS